MLRRTKTKTKSRNQADVENGETEIRLMWKMEKLEVGKVRKV